MEISKFEFQALHNWFLISGRKQLPWRKHQPGDLNHKQNGYLVWLSEILLQQTQAERVIEYYENILKNFPTIQSLAQTNYETFFPYYEGLGYYTRARNLLKCAQIVCEKYQGIFPEKTEELLSLPGIGPYTAEAIRSFAYNIPTLSFDTNLRKVFARYYFGSRFHPISKEIETRLLSDFIEFTNTTGTSSADINAAFMDLGNIWCKNSKDTINFELSPFLNCLFTQTKGSLEIQETRKKVYFPISDAQIVVILHENHKKYFSINHETYSPFILSPISTVEMDSGEIQLFSEISNPFIIMKTLSVRDWVKKYFEEIYQLKVSVRPEHKKEYKDGVPYIFVRAQIQDGKHNFGVFNKNDLSN